MDFFLYFWLAIGFVAVFGTVLAFVDRIQWDRAPLFASLRNFLRAHRHVTPAVGPTHDLTVQLLRIQLGDARRSLLLASLCALAMGYFGWLGGGQIEHDLHAGMHDCKVVDGPAHTAAEDCVEDDIRAWNERAGMHADRCLAGRWVHIAGHPHVRVVMTDTGSYRLSVDDYWLHRPVEHGSFCDVSCLNNLFLKASGGQ